MGITPKKTCIVGAGGFGRETLTCLMAERAFSAEDAARQVVFMEPDDYSGAGKILGVPVVRQSTFQPDIYEVVVAIGDSQLRRKVVESLPVETRYITIIHPTVAKTPWVEIGEGSVLLAGVSLTCQINIGRHAQLNPNTTIAHDCKIGDYFTAAPSACVNGICSIGDRVFLGSNAALRQGVSVCDDVTVGMGSVVVKNIHESGVYYGIPARKKSS